MESVECGAAALSIILGYWGRVVPLERLRADCGVSRNGSNARDILAAARQHGLEATGLQMELEDLKRMRSPVIVFWAFQHFMVVEGFARRFNQIVVSVNDPAGGRRLMSWDEFDAGFTGVALLFKPGPDFAKGGRRPSVTRALRERRVSSGRTMPLVLVASLLLVIPGVIGPAFNRVFLDSVLSGMAPDYLWPLIGVMVVTVAVAFLLSGVQRQYLMRWESRVSLVSSTRFLRHTLRLPVGFFLQRKAAEVNQRVSFNDRVAEVVSRDLTVSAVNLLLVVFYAVFLMRYDVLLGCIGIGTAIANVILLQRVISARRAINDSINADTGNMIGTTFHTLQTIETIKATAGEDTAHMRWAGFYAKVVGANQRIGVPTVIIAVVPPLLASINTGFILMLGGLRVIDGAMTVGVLMSFQSLMAGFNRPIIELTNLSSRIQSLGTEIARLRDVENYPVDACFTQTEGPVGTRLSGAMKADKVAFGYSDSEPPIIAEMSFEVAPGGRVALVGTSGSGKSTVGRLIAGLVEPTGGSLEFDGRPLGSYPRTVLAASIGYVDQDITLFEGTVKSNISMWDESMPDDVVIKALKDAEIHDAISARPGGIHARIGENGGNLSGGQRQRLEIARALAAQPTVLVMDEATSALDPETERQVMDNLSRRGCSAVIIAHRLSTIRDADEILVMDKGRIAERGTHDHLLQHGQIYPNLIKATENNEEVAA
ncbi:hypothetical protein VV02_06555 [Luteipulveratus mongoliensis]|uniref:ABC transporter n=2 Tax=Luteipulveratus mongoliensis TaxID=571913 RepID=A0A0K1JPR5_9MICO|nr:hypothetical protein VV02_06555 [Luteipulveratus mongoliensis]